GKTPLLKGFISQRTKRPFDAYLVLNFKTGKIGFEFDKTERKPTRKTTSKTTAKKEEAPQEVVKVVKAVKKKAPAKKKPTKAKE
ncbi:MAG: hypothetical protein RR889_07810, partial [Akkermansia sp.]